MGVYQSIQSNTSFDSDLVITKPSGLAVGDLMVAGIFINGDGSGTASVNTPSGWTLQESVNTSLSLRTLTVFIKYADSADVAASNFTFAANSSDGLHSMCGHLIRVSSPGTKINETSNTSISSGTSLVLTGFTPLYQNMLYLAFIGVSDINIATISGVSMATSNPSWTERGANSTNDGSSDSAFAVYTASRPEVTATGDITFTFTNPSNNRGHGIVIAVSTQESATVTPTTKINAYAHTWVQSAVIDAVADAPTTLETNPTVWTPITKT